jgi:hypothetical protein
MKSTKEMTRVAAINRLHQMLMEEISFLEQCEKQQIGDDIIKYHRDGVKALKMAITIVCRKRKS